MKEGKYHCTAAGINLVLQVIAEGIKLKTNKDILKVSIFNADELGILKFQKEKINGIAWQVAIIVVG